MASFSMDVHVLAYLQPCSRTRTGLSLHFMSQKNYQQKTSLESEAMCSEPQQLFSQKVLHWALGNSPVPACLLQKNSTTQRHHFAPTNRGKPRGFLIHIVWRFIQHREHANNTQSNPTALQTEILLRASKVSLDKAGFTSCQLPPGVFCFHLADSRQVSLSTQVFEFQIQKV